MISNINLTNGVINVTANNVTIKDSEITTGDGTLGAELGDLHREGVTERRSIHDDAATDCQGSALFAGVYNTSGDSLVMDHDYGACWMGS